MTTRDDLRGRGLRRPVPRRGQTATAHWGPAFVSPSCSCSPKALTACCHEVDACCSEKMPSNGGEVRRIANSDHCLCVSKSRSALRRARRPLELPHDNVQSIGEAICVRSATSVHEETLSRCSVRAIYQQPSSSESSSFPRGAKISASFSRSTPRAKRKLTLEKLPVS